MDARFQPHNPSRYPNWRSERAAHVAGNRPQPSPPQRYDDYYVRAYRLYLMDLYDAGDDER